MAGQLISLLMIIEHLLIISVQVVTLASLLRLHHKVGPVPRPKRDSAAPPDDLS